MDARSTALRVIQPSRAGAGDAASAGPAERACPGGGGSVGPPTGACPTSGTSRRDFLEGAVRLAGGALVLFAGASAAGSSAAAGASTGGGPRAASASTAGGPRAAGASTAGGPRAAEPKPTAERYDWEEHRYAYLIDTSKCIGCGSCVRACKAENGVPDGFFRTWIERYVVGIEGSNVDSPNGGMDGFPPIQTGFVATKSFFVPKMCMHCKETPCVQVCPVGASYRTKDGVIMVDGQRCIGCGYCVQACPYGSRFLNPVTHTAEKCTWCYHRITKGLKPACVEVCPTATRQFGDMKREDDPVRKAVEQDRVAILQPHLLTEPQCYYLHLDKEVR